MSHVSKLTLLRKQKLNSIVLTMFVTGVVLRRLATIPKLEAVSNSAKMGYSQTGFLLLSIFFEHHHYFISG